VNPKYLKYLFWPLWFVLVPLALAWATQRLLVPSGEPGSGIFDKVRWFVQDQPIPTLIVLFTVYEMALYHFRHSLPLAAAMGVAGRTDLPPHLRRTYEHAVQLLDESDRVLKKHRRRIERELPAATREEVSDALGELREAMDRTPFDAEEFSAVYEGAQKLVGRHLSRWQKSELREYTESILVAVAVALLLRAFVVEAFKIPSGSMLPTLQLQDHIFVNKLAYGLGLPFSKNRAFESLPPKRGDVIVFEFPDSDPRNPRQDYIKRVIATEGDTLEVVDGHPIINGWRVPSCRVGTYDFRETQDSFGSRGELFVEFLGDYAYLTLYENDHLAGREGPYKVMPGETWVLGDNRNNSSDSRAWNNRKGGGVPDANIKGRAMFVWYAAELDRILTNVLGTPKLPKDATPELHRGVEDCLAKRPPRSETTPPPP
jgi:signal peptidase I